LLIQTAYSCLTGTFTVPREHVCKGLFSVLKLMSFLLHSTSHSWFCNKEHKLEVCHPRCVCEYWKGYVVKHNSVN